MYGLQCMNLFVRYLFAGLRRFNVVTMAYMIWELLLVQQDYYPVSTTQAEVLGLLKAASDQLESVNNYLAVTRGSTLTADMSAIYASPTVICYATSQASTYSVTPYSLNDAVAALIARSRRVYTAPSVRYDTDDVYFVLKNGPGIYRKIFYTDLDATL